MFRLTFKVLQCRKYSYFNCINKGAAGVLWHRKEPCTKTYQPPDVFNVFHTFQSAARQSLREQSKFCQKHQGRTKQMSPLKLTSKKQHKALEPLVSDNMQWDKSIGSSNLNKIYGSHRYCGLSFKLCNNLGNQIKHFLTSRNI